jgi:hypothetical protein
MERPLHTKDRNNNGKRGHTSMRRVGFEPMIPVFERSKTTDALNSAATGIYL